METNCKFVLFWKGGDTSDRSEIEHIHSNLKGGIIMTKFVSIILSLFLAISLMAGAASPLAAETLRMMVWESYAHEKLQQQFIKLVKEKHGIDLKLEITHVTSNDDFFPSLRDGKTDLISPSHPIPKDKRFRLIDLRLVLPLNIGNIPNYKHIITGLQNADYCTQSGKVYAVPVARGPYGLAYNTALLKEPPDTWNVLWDPAYKGKYSLGKDQYQQNVNITALAMGMPVTDISDYRKLNTPKFQEKLAQLAINARNMWEGEDRADDLRGLSVAAVWGPSLAELKKEGEIWKMADPKEGTTAWVDSFMISHTLEKKPKLRLIAEEWLNYILSDDYQTYLVREIGVAPVTTTVKENLTPEEIEQFHLDDPTFFEKKRILWDSLEKLDRKGLKRLWKEALMKRG